jgi:septum formation protein
MNSRPPQKILLASSSPYRKALIERIIKKFDFASPDINEDQLDNEPLQSMSVRLAKEKALALADSYPKHLIIGSDQVACLRLNNIETQLKKPITPEQCFLQLKQCQGKSVHFYTGLCLFNARTQTIQSSVECYETKFRNLSDRQIKNYIEREPAFDCAGGFKMEGLGIALFNYIKGDDPNTLIGLPLIKLIDMLQNEGVDVLGW